MGRYGVTEMSKSLGAVAQAPAGVSCGNEEWEP